MKYFVIPFLLVLSIYPFSYARYSWRKKNKLGAAGMILLILLQLVCPAVVLFIK